MSTIRKILLIHPDGNFFNNPTLKCVIDLLLSHGVEITVRYPRSKLHFPQITGVRYLGYGYILTKIKNLIFYHLSCPSLAWLCVWIENFFIYESYDLVVGVDRQGLIEAGCIYKLRRTPFVFFSFEIFFESETSSFFKSLERKFAKDAKYWFVQDELRSYHLQRENNLDVNNCKLIPLASSGPGRLSTSRLRDKLGIPENKNVAIVIGSITSWSMTAEIVDSARSWSDNWVLIVHERYGDTGYRLKKLGVDLSSVPTGKVYVSNQSRLMIDDMGEILSGVSVGLAFYKPISNSPGCGKNLEYLGLASGKISTFLRYGIPVIMNEIGIYASLAIEHGFGFVSQEPKGIGKLLPLCTNSSLSSNARHFYESRLDFSNYKDSFWQDLTSTISNRHIRK